MRTSPHVLILTSLLIVTASFAAEAPKTFSVGEFNFARPANWEWVPTTSAMRKAELKVESKDKKEKAEVIFFHFGESNGGGTQANVDRWLGQFKEARDKINSKVDAAKINGRTVTFVQAEGTYMSGMPGGPKTPQPNAMLLGAILESEKGNVFVRMNGPAAVVKGAQGEFKKMIESAAKGA
ncbi:MAG TPA: hypothetical protein VJ063_18220 [Verrucomicrobiae bacterium]|nr:hypothetical protein [Verrucomicrobiae bacterium]